MGSPGRQTRTTLAARPAHRGGISGPPGRQTGPDQWLCDVDGLGADGRARGERELVEAVNEPVAMQVRDGVGDCDARPAERPAELVDVPELTGCPSSRRTRRTPPAICSSLISDPTGPSVHWRAMGSMVTVTILTDHLRELESDPAFLLEAIRSGMAAPTPRWQHPGVWVHSPHHRRELGVFVAGGEFGRPWQLGGGGVRDAIEQFAAENPAMLRLMAADVEMIGRWAERAADALREALEAAETGSSG